MNHRTFIFTRLASLLLALPMALGGSALRAADEPAPAPPQGREKDAREKDSREKDAREKDEKRPRPDGPRPEGSTRGDGPRPIGPRGEWGPRPPGQGTGWADQFSPDELRQIVEAVESKNKSLAEKMKERFAEAMTKKPAKLTPEQVEAAMSIFEDREPHLASRLKESLKENPDRIATMLAFQWPRLEKAIELKKSDRELYDAQTAEILKQGEARSTVWKLRKATGEKNEAEANKLKEELKVRLAEQHQTRQVIRRLELARMNDKIRKLSEEITEEESKSASLIEKHFTDILKWTESGRWERGEKSDKHDKSDKSDKSERKEK